MVQAEYGAEGDRDWRRVTADPEGGSVTFHRCHQSRRLLSAGADPEFTCRLSELRGVCPNFVKGVGRVLEVVTPAGRACLPESARGFEAVRAALIDGLPPGAGLRWHEYPAAGLLLLPAVLAATLAVAALFVTAVSEFRVPDRVVTGLALGLMAAVPVAGGLLTWRGRARR